MTRDIAESFVLDETARVQTTDTRPAIFVRDARDADMGVVTSIYADDKDFIRAAVLALAPFHGRLTIGSSKIAGQSLPPGMALPQLLHGGPGRAGGGEELGGRRGMALYMQRTALQGDRALIEAIAKK